MGLIVIYATLIFFCIFSSAFAYVDPGTGSYLLQIIIGFALAGLYALKHYWARLRNWFTMKKKD
ncbi:MAG: hypothetical protein NTX75_04705 [Proteobacteria bacterium]|nr:hypothetical protein [Pseudomonadota bacterium]